MDNASDADYRIDPSPDNFIPPPFLIAGEPYVPTKLAASTSGLSPTCLALLCRRGTLRATRLGRTWFIQTHSLASFLAARKP